MKMKYLTILFVALIAQSCSNEKIENDWTADNLQGKVMSHSEYIYIAKERFGNIEKGERILSRVFRGFIEYIGSNQRKYAENGNKIEENWYKLDGSLDMKKTYKYAENGNKIEENWYKLDGSLDKKKTYKYAENGNRTEENSYEADGSLSYKYGDAPKTYKYDEKGNKIETNIYRSDGSFRHKDKYKYDEKGYKIERYYSNSDGRVVLVSTSKYDKKGNKIECNGCGWEAEDETYKYDEKGNIIEYKGIFDNGFLLFKKSYEYEFDKRGNWIKQIEFLDGIPTYILERQYEYYD
jgi:hypothetical protein